MSTMLCSSEEYDRMLRTCDPDQPHTNWILEKCRAKHAWEEKFLKQRCGCGQPPIILASTFSQDCAACAWITCMHMQGTTFQYAVYGFWFADTDLLTIPSLLYTENVERTESVSCAPLSDLGWKFDRVTVDRTGVFVRTVAEREIAYPCRWQHFFPRPDLPS